MIFSQVRTAYHHQSVALVTVEAIAGATVHRALGELRIVGVPLHAGFARLGEHRLVLAIALLEGFRRMRKLVVFYVREAFALARLLVADYIHIVDVAVDFEVVLEVCFGHRFRRDDEQTLDFLVFVFFAL